jgi:VWFA-related protein
MEVPSMLHHSCLNVSALLRNTAAIAFCLALLPLSLDAQEPPQAPALRESVEVRLIEIDAVVTDRRGNPLTGLTPADFVVLENGQPQEITNFTEYRDGRNVTAAAAGEAESPVMHPQPRTIVILVDALPLLGADRRNLFNDLRALVDRTMREGDRGQVLGWHDRYGMRALSPMSFARAEILEAIGAAEATLHADMEDLTIEAHVEWYRELEAENSADGIRRFDGEGHAQATVRQAVEQEYSLMRRKTAAIQRLVDVMAEPTHRNVLIYVSGSFPMTAGKRFFSGIQTRFTVSDEADYNTSQMLEAITRTANAQGVILYALRPHLASGTVRIRSTPALQSQEFGNDVVDPLDRTFAIQPLHPHLTDMSRDQTLLQNDVQALAYVAQETGGSVAIGPSAIKQAAERIGQELGSYYTLAYRARSDGADRERRIEVRPRNRSQTVRTRKAILDRSDETRARDLLIARLFEQGSGGNIDFEIETGTARYGENQVVIPIELAIPVEQLQFELEDGELAARFSILLVSGENIGAIARLQEEARKVVAPPGSKPAGVVRHQLELVAPPGKVNVSVAVFDETSGLTGVHSIEVERGKVRGQAVSSGPDADAAWQEAIHRATEERKPIVAYFRPTRCSPCTRFERESLTHPAIRRRLSDVVFVPLPAAAGEISRQWSSRQPGLGVFDQQGNFRFLFEGLPDTVTMGVILDDVNRVAPHLQRAAARAADAQPAEGELDAAIAYLMLGRRSDARSALERALASGSAETRQHGRVALALVEAEEGRPAAALQELEQIIAEAETASVAGEAWLTIGLIQRGSGARGEAARAFASARELLGSDSRIAATSDVARAALESASSASGVIRIIPPSGAAAGDRLPVKMKVASADVATVVLLANGVEIGRIRRPPFSTTIAAGNGRQTIVAVAFDGLGIELGRDELTVGEAGARRQLDQPEATGQLVALPVTVSGAAAGAALSSDQILIREGSRRRPVDSVRQATEAPLTVGVIIDVSRSMQTDLPAIKEAAINFIDSLLSEGERAFVVSFGSRARLIQPATANKAMLRQSIMSLRAGGSSALHDAIALGLLQMEGVEGRRAVVIFTKGAERASRYGSSDLEDLARRARVPIHLIAAAPERSRRGTQGSEWSTMYNSMSALAQSTGGNAYRLDRLDALAQFYQQIEADLQSQHLLFVRTEAAASEDEWRKIGVEVTTPGVRVQAPEGYYLPW